MLYILGKDKAGRVLSVDSQRIGKLFVDGIPADEYDVFFIENEEHQYHHVVERTNDGSHSWVKSSVLLIGTDSPGGLCLAYWHNDGEFFVNPIN